MRRIKDFLKGYKLWIYSFIGVSFLYEIFIARSINEFMSWLLVSLLILSIWLHELKWTVSFGWSFAFLIICILLLIFDEVAIAEKAAISVYIFIVVGVEQIIIEYIRGERKNNRGKKV